VAAQLSWLSQSGFASPSYIFSGGTNLSRFDMCVVFMTNYFSVKCDVLINNETFLMTDFMNLNIKSGQSFRGNHIVIQR
jgi:hypothetical protein